MDCFIKTYPVRKVGSRYVMAGNIRGDLKPKYLAMNPKNDELFLLLGDNGCFSLLKGNLQRDMRLCNIKSSIVCDFCCLINFEQDGVAGYITASKFSQEENPIYDCVGAQKAEELKLVSFEIE